MLNLPKHKCLYCMSRGSRGVTILETAAVLPILFLILFAMLDLGLAATRYNALAETARRVGREAIIHGSQAPEEIMRWGPNEYVGNAADNTEFGLLARKSLIAMPADMVNLRVTWLDDDNSPRDRVQVDVSYRHEPLIPKLFIWGPLDLRATTTMRIVN